MPAVCRWSGASGGLIYTVRGRVLQLRQPTPSPSPTPVLAVFTIPPGAGEIVAVAVAPSTVDESRGLAIVTAAGWLFQPRARLAAPRKRRRADRSTAADFAEANADAPADGHGEGDEGDREEVETSEPAFGPSAYAVEHLADLDATHAPSHPSPAPVLARETTTIAVVPSTERVLVVAADPLPSRADNGDDRGGTARGGVRRSLRRRWTAICLPPVDTDADSAPCVLDEAPTPSPSPPPHLTLLARAGGAPHPISDPTAMDLGPQAEADGAGAAVDTGVEVTDLRGCAAVEPRFFDQLFGLLAPSAVCVITLPTGKVVAVGLPSGPTDSGRLSPQLLHASDEPLHATFPIHTPPPPATSSARGTASAAATAAAHLGVAPPDTAVESGWVTGALAAVAGSGRVVLLRQGSAGRVAVSECRTEGPIHSVAALDNSTLILHRRDGTLALVTLPPPETHAESASNPPSRGGLRRGSAPPPLLPSRRLAGPVATWMAAVSPTIVALHLSSLAPGELAICTLASLDADAAAAGPDPLDRMSALRSDLAAIAAAEQRVHAQRVEVERTIADANVALRLLRQPAREGGGPREGEEGEGGGGSGGVTCTIRPVVPTPSLRAVHTPAVAITVEHLPQAVLSSERWSLVVSIGSTRERRPPVVTHSVPLHRRGGVGRGRVALEIPLEAAAIPCGIRVLLVCNLHDSRDSHPPTAATTGGCDALASGADVAASVLATRTFDILDFLLDAQTPAAYGGAVEARTLPRALADRINRRGLHAPASHSPRTSRDRHAAESIHRADVPLPPDAVARITRGGLGTGGSGEGGAMEVDGEGYAGLREVLAAFVDLSRLAPPSSGQGSSLPATVEGRGLCGAIVVLEAVAVRDPTPRSTARRTGTAEATERAVIKVSSSDPDVTDDLCAAIIRRLAILLDPSPSRNPSGSIRAGGRDGKKMRREAKGSVEGGAAQVPSERLDSLRGHERRVTHKYSTEAGLLQPALDAAWAHRHQQLAEDAGWGVSPVDARERERDLLSGRKVEAELTFEADFRRLYRKLRGVAVEAAAVPSTSES